MAQNYNDTIHLPSTPFAMRAGLPKKEPQMLADWQKNHVYEQMIQNNEGKPRFVLHDGPPYANGNIHMGTALNKIIKDIINCLLVGWDERGLHIALNFDGTKSIDSLGLSENGIEIIKGAQGASGNTRIATFTMGFVLVMITLIVVLNLVRSRTGRAVMAIRDNRIAAESVGINVTKYKLIAFVTSASLAGAAGALFGLNYSSVSAAQFDFNQSILVLVYVVLGGLGNIWGSIIATVVLYVLPEALREFNDLRMLVYAIVLILVMLITNNPTLRSLLETAGKKFRRGKSREGGVQG